MFAVKPSSAKEEFEQLHKLLGTAAVAEVLDKRPGVGAVEEVEGVEPDA